MMLNEENEPYYFIIIFKLQYVIKFSNFYPVKMTFLEVHYILLNILAFKYFGLTFAYINL